ARERDDGERVEAPDVRERRGCETPAFDPRHLIDHLVEGRRPPAARRGVGVNTDAHQGLLRLAVPMASDAQTPRARAHHTIDPSMAEAALGGDNDDARPSESTAYVIEGGVP